MLLIHGKLAGNLSALSFPYFFPFISIIASNFSIHLDVDMGAVYEAVLLMSLEKLKVRSTTDLKTSHTVLTKIVLG